MYCIGIYKTLIQVSSFRLSRFEKGWYVHMTSALQIVGVLGIYQYSEWHKYVIMEMLCDHGDVSSSQELPWMQMEVTGYAA